MLYGYAGKILHVDLTKGELSTEQPTEEFYKTYIGGSAMGTYYVFKNTPAGADPLGPENTLAIMISATTGVSISGNSRMNATAKSPLTGLIGDSQVGGFFPAEMKFAGFDGIVFTGKSPKPVYLWVHDGEAELKDASHLWGKITMDCEKMIRQELSDPKIEIAQVGPSGEKMARFAAIMNMSNRANGRTGMGAVMGSKNLKAIAVRGHQKVKTADPAAIIKLARLAPKRVNEIPDMKGLQDFGTASVLNYQNASGGLPTCNYTSGTFDDAEDLSGEHMSETILIHNDTCYACVVRCKRVVETDYKNTHVDPYYGGPEYETLSTFGSYCAIGDMNAVSLANQICDQYGLDTIACGATVAFAMDCFEHGYLTLKDTDGIDLRFGNADAMLAMVEKIARREGLGDLLANGSAYAAKKIGHGSEDLVVAVKNHEVPAHMPQVKRSLALIYAVNPFGADHQSHEHDPAYTPDTAPYNLERMAEIGLTNPMSDRVLDREKVKMALTTELDYCFIDTADLCQFVYGPAWQVYGPKEQAELMRATTGWDWTVSDLLKVGERRLNMLRAFNAREGAGREHDTLPKRIYDEPLKGGASDGVAVTRQEVADALDIYYEMCGWDVATGKPTKAKLAELGLGWMA
ncbi:MAG TPA: aldehyde ferredoxin oxidoreductase family protein [Anaerolineales bacterium]|nr:aldehyde ferredoxin oxidoreductase family protein [Anaerolineales bacterium]